MVLESFVMIMTCEMSFSPMGGRLKQKQVE